jgi:hypothetical protein
MLTFEGRSMFAMKIDRRQFLKVTAGAIGTTVAAEAVSLGADMSWLAKYPSKDSGYTFRID